MNQVKSYGKINFELRVLKKLNKNLHDIRNLYALIDLFDNIYISKIKSKNDEIIFKGKFSKYINKKDNSIKKTLILLRKKKIINSFYKIKIYKNIPVFSGLGGGSSNAFFLSNYFIKKNDLLKYHQDFNKTIGTDYSLFFNTFGYQVNLKKINSIKKKIKIFLVIVFPNVKCSTQSIYSNFELSKKRQIKKLKKFDFKSLSKYLINSDNDLQKVVELRYPKITNLINNIGSQKGCVLARMTGSGSACFGLFKSKSQANLAYKNLRKKFPKYWCVNTKTI